MISERNHNSNQSVIGSKKNFRINQMFDNAATLENKEIVCIKIKASMKYHCQSLDFIPSRNKGDE